MLAVPSVRDTPSVGLDMTTRGLPRQSSLHQIGGGSAAFIRQDWDLAVRRGQGRPALDMFEVFGRTGPPILGAAFLDAKKISV